MGLRSVGLLPALVALSLLGACASPPHRTLSLHAPQYATLPNGTEPLNPGKLSSLYTSVASVPGDNVIRYLERKRGHALNMLSLSGGGQNGAFGAGFLKGWRQHGDRPQFDLVGGVSTGALLATHAFLGTPEDDATLEKMYTQVTDADIYTDRGLLSLLSADSLKDTGPLRAMIAKYITADTLKRVAAAYDDNRLLVVGTTNIDYGQTWVWNMTMIAKAGELELYRDVLLASASFPIVFPPVEIDGHLFVDGAARSNLVIPGMGGQARPNPPLHGAGNLYLIDNGKITTPPQALIRALGEIAATTISVMMEQSMQTALMRSFFGTRVLGYKFNMVGIPDNVDVGNDVLAFNQTQMRAAFAAGEALGMQEKPWQATPTNSGDLPSWVFKEMVAPPASAPAP
ncbi:patatin-like phospholipase family protein [Dongia rigui]|uniref:Patatin-like phospholipase family protein n=1 Tax=Dongia rigui TaxID=940149 RepID=A0ABU5DUB7_9PROT|nr:patatin-like phospholipase family protein [Dongia rigui]MDY0870900.1 patatin-like phospholipase family protein [Dongia rigui]